jgi:GNAT superfamily N-acetyltransferase
MTFEELLRAADRVRFAPARLTDARWPHVPNEQLLRKGEDGFLALQCRATVFRVQVRRQKESGQLAIVQEWTDERARLHRARIGGKQGTQRLEIDIQAPQTPAGAVNWPAGVHLSRISGEHISPAGDDLTPACTDSNCAPRDHRQARRLVPMRIVGKIIEASAEPLGRRERVVTPDRRIASRFVRRHGCVVEAPLPIVPEAAANVLNAIAVSRSRARTFKTASTRLREHRGMSNEASTAPAIDIRTGYSPGAIGRIGELHGCYYADAWGSGAAFEIQMLRELCTFVEQYDRHHDLLLTAHVGDVVIGSTVVMGTPATREARLRFVIVDPPYQGRGAGKAMLNAALTWCQAHEYKTVFLWTVDGLPASRAMYDRAGFRIVARVEDARYSVPLTSLKMELSLL